MVFQKTPSWTQYHIATVPYLRGFSCPRRWVKYTGKVCLTIGCFILGIILMSLFFDNNDYDRLNALAIALIFLSDFKQAL